MMKKPIIGISSGFTDGGDIFLRRKYCQRVEQAGGIPIVLPVSACVEESLGICDGLLFSGGGDVRPELYGLYDYDPEPLFEVSEERDRFDIALARLAYERDLPVFAVCRGIQVLNVALGGTLLPDMPGHRQKEARDVASHAVNVTAGSLLHTITGEEVLHVNSFHHQSVDQVASALRISGIADDGIIEALEASDRHFMLGVQWHPEHLEDAVSAALFHAFIQSAKPK